MNFSLSQICRVIGISSHLDGKVTGYSVDSRTLAKGDLFFAIRGERLDGHDYLAQAFEKGAIAAVVDRDVPPAQDVLQVPGFLAALQRRAARAPHETGRPGRAGPGRAG